ncbi:hypothetical protein DPEC_G00023660 [Dallia pectoralis]|uniref:Uncharacterized protein n=1 Tax=Dallia pectoralis TaxID=75939 RepID=A0ACC2HGU7_DALPE|nr:hypothetical protein DPEC_G00023660 [Dallia pectoralis]
MKGHRNMTQIIDPVRTLNSRTRSQRQDFTIYCILPTELDAFPLIKKDRDAGTIQGTLDLPEELRRQLEGVIGSRDLQGLGGLELAQNTLNNDLQGFGTHQ